MQILPHAEIQVEAPNTTNCSLHIRNCDAKLDRLEHVHIATEGRILFVARGTQRRLLNKAWEFNVESNEGTAAAGTGNFQTGLSLFFEVPRQTSWMRIAPNWDNISVKCWMEKAGNAIGLRCRP